jgi:hypothetical protein
VPLDGARQTKAAGENSPAPLFLKQSRRRRLDCIRPFGQSLRSSRWLLFAFGLLVLLLLLLRHHDLHLTDQSLVPSPSQGHMIAPIAFSYIERARGGQQNSPKNFLFFISLTDVHVIIKDSSSS